jgi:outer membrane protein assembly factor BamB
VPFGGVEAFAAIPGSDRWGSPNLGGSMATGGGLVFAGGARDRCLHAFDEETGAELWSWQLPAGVHAAPMTYLTASGRQFVVVAAGGHKDLHTTPGDYIVAFALPGATPTSAALPKVESGRYLGHMILDATRGDATWDLHVTQDRVSMTITMRHGQIQGSGTGVASGGSIAVDVAWKYPAGHCSGTMHLTGALANAGSALIGELAYGDACDGGKQKGGTFAVWRGRRTIATLRR